MTQKWNLQDIRPATPRREKTSQRTKSISSTNNDGDQPIARRETQSINQPDNYSEIRPFDTDESTNPRPARSSHQNSSPGKQKSTKRTLFIAVILFFVITGLGVFVSYLMGGTTVTVTPKTKDLTVNADITAYKEKKTGELSYEILTLDATGERQVEASGQEEVSVQTRGELEITKNTPGSERLIKNTRFATADGLIFRIEESVVVPGATTEGGQTIPGSIKAAVFADEAGAKYNLPAGTKLQVPGFKEGGYTELYNAISASNPVAFTNGFVGPKFIINEDTLATARQSLQAELKESLNARINNERPAGYTSFPGSVTIVYNELPAVQYGDNLVTIKEQAVLQIPLFKADEFASFIAKETILGYEDEPVRIANVGDLNFSYLSATTSQMALASLASIDFRITGEAEVVWTFDEEQLKQDLSGQEKTAIPQIMTKYPGIERSEVKIRPVWQRTLPTDQSKITIVESL